MKLPDNENLTAVKEKILPVLKKYRAVLAVLLAGVLLLASGAQRKHGAGADRKCGHNGFTVV